MQTSSSATLSSFKNRRDKDVGLQDIAASKVFAISARATKKDFWDLVRLLDEFSFLEIASFYDKRYEHKLAIAISKMLTYFEEVEESDTPICLLNKNWDQVKKVFSKKLIYI